MSEFERSDDTGTTTDTTPEEPRSAATAAIPIAPEVADHAASDEAESAGAGPSSTTADGAPEEAAPARSRRWPGPEAPGRDPARTERRAPTATRTPTKTTKVARATRRRRRDEDDDDVPPRVGGRGEDWTDASADRGLRPRTSATTRVKTPAYRLGTAAGPASATPGRHRPRSRSPRSATAGLRPRVATPRPTAKAHRRSAGAGGAVGAAARAVGAATATAAALVPAARRRPRAEWPQSRDVRGRGCRGQRHRRRRHRDPGFARRGDAGTPPGHAPEGPARGPLPHGGARARRRHGAHRRARRPHARGALRRVADRRHDFDRRQHLPRPRAERVARHGGRVHRHRHTEERCAVPRRRRPRRLRDGRRRAAPHRADAAQRPVDHRAGHQEPDRAQGRAPHAGGEPRRPVRGDGARPAADVRHLEASARRRAQAPAPHPRQAPAERRGAHRPYRGRRGNRRRARTRPPTPQRRSGSRSPSWPRRPSPAACSTRSRRSRSA